MKNVSKIFLIVIIIFSAFGVVVDNTSAASKTINFSDGKMFAPNCFCGSDVREFNLAPWCEDRGWCKDETILRSTNLTKGKYRIKVNLGGLTSNQKYESVIFTLNGKNYTIPDLGGNSQSTGTASYTLGVVDLSGKVTFKGKHKYANIFTGKWYSDKYSKLGSGNAAESVALNSVVFEAIPPKPTCTMSANPQLITSGNKSTLSWSSTNATSIIINNGIGKVSANGNRDVSPSSDTTYIGIFTGPGGSVICQATVEVVNDLPPTCSIEANPATINRGGSSILSWTSNNAIRAVMDRGIGSIGLNGSRVVAPNSTTVYTATFFAKNGESVTCPVTVNVSDTPVVPTCTMNVNPTNISRGESSTLSWTSSNATSATINQGIGSVSVNGNRDVSPNSTITYSGTFAGPGGSVTCDATLNVGGTSSDPSINIDKDDNDNNDDTQTVSSGGTATFRIRVVNDGSSALSDVVITDTLAPDCNRTASESSNLYSGLTFDPGESFDYTCTRSGATASYTNTARVNANEIGSSATVNDTDTTAVVIGGSGTSTTCSMSFNPSSINVGDATTLSWSSTNAISASINQGVGSVNTNGSRQIFRTSNATYTGTFVGPSETVTCSAAITVGGGGGGNKDPRITLSSENFAEPASYIYLSQIPYTGVPQALIAFLGYFFRFFFFGGALVALYKLREVKA